MKVATVRPRRGRLSGFGCGTAIFTAIAVCLAIIVAASVVSVISSASSNVASSVLHAQPGSIPWSPRRRLTVLLLGVSGPSPRNVPTESLTVASLDPATLSGTLISIPANLWVTIPGYGQGQIAQAYADGGPRLALLVTQSVLHVPIPYYAVLDDTTFRRLVDGFGGVILRVPPQARLGMSGLRKLDAATALTYIHAGRAPDTGPTGRMARVRQILFALKADATQATGLVQIPTMLNAFGADIPSNFPFNQVPVLARILSTARQDRVRVISLEPSNGTVTAYGQYLVADWQSVQAAAQKAISLDPADRTGQVTVLNATDQQGEAATLATWLQQARIPVASYASASSSATRTEVINNSSAPVPAPHLASDVGALLQAPVITRKVAGTTTAVVVIIGADFQDPTQN